MDSESAFKKFLCYMGWAYVVFLLYFVIFRNSGYAFDFRWYLDDIGGWYTSGLDPHKAGAPLAYPPMTMNIFRPFLYLNLRVAVMIWLVLKMVAFIGLFKLWNKHFMTLDAKDPYTVWFFILAFNGAIHYDIISGNISGFLQMMIWCGFVALLRNSLWPYCALVVAAALVKADLLAFLGLLLFIDRRPHWRAFAASVAAFCGLFALNHLFYPQLIQSYYKLFLALNDFNRGVNNPSTLAFLRDWLANLQGRYPSIPDHVAEPLYVLIVATVMTMSYNAYRRYRDKAGPWDKKALMLFFCILFGVLTPRIPPYLYALMVLPSFFLLRVYGWRMAVPLAAVFIMFPHEGTSFPTPLVITFRWLICYVPLAGLYVVWYFFLLYFKEQGIRKPVDHAATS